MRLCSFLIETMMESVLMVVGLTADNGQDQTVYHISLELPDSVWNIGRTPADVNEGAAACVVGNTLCAVGIGHARNQLWKWNKAADWTRCADMISARRDHCVAVVDSTLYALGGLVEADEIETTLSSVEAFTTRRQTNGLQRVN